MVYDLIGLNPGDTPLGGANLTEGENASAHLMGILTPTTEYARRIARIIEHLRSSVPNRPGKLCLYVVYSHIKSKFCILLFI
jgi:hypothetical protein